MREIAWHEGRKTRYVAAGTREALDEAEPHGIGHSHEYNRNGCSCRFQGNGFSWPGGNKHIRFECDEFARKRRYAIRDFGIVTILDEQVLALDPALFTQTVVATRRGLANLEKESRDRYGEALLAPTNAVGETSSAAVAAMNSRRFI